MEHCTLCPRHCNARRTPEGGNGFCGLGSTLRLVRIAPHYWEEPPISGVRGTGALFFSGCTLRCAYCQNGDISHRNLGRDFTPAQLAEHMRRLVDHGRAHHELHHRHALCGGHPGDAGALPAAGAPGMEHLRL